jgi:tetratricopeptide (TPR) repeat protein
VPPAVKQIVTRALQTVPDQRYPDMRTLLAELRTALRPRARRGVGVVAIAVSVAAVIAVGALAYSHRAHQPSALDAGMHVTPGRPPATAAAGAAYDAAVQAERDGNLPEQKRSLTTAIAADPALGAAYLRLVLVKLADVSDLSDDPLLEAEALATYHKALDHRSTLGEIDAGILDAWEPRFRAPPDRAERSRRLAALATRFPTDVRVQTLFADSLLHSAQLAEAKTQIERASAIDPAYIPAFATNIAILNRLGDDARARAVADRCIATSASAVSCLEARLTMSNDSGQCSDLMADAKRVIAIDPSSQTGYTALADAMASLHAPIDSVAETLKHADRLVSDADARHVGELYSTELIDVLRGDLVGADRAAGDAVTFASEHPGQNAVSPALRQLALVVEEGDANRARTLARRVRALIDATGVGEPDINTEALLVTLLQRAGGITRDELHARQAKLAELQRADDERRGGKTDAFRLWGWIYGGNIANASEAGDAITALAQAGGPDPKFANVPYFAQGLGTMYAFSGHGAEAIPYLARAEASCYQLEEAIDLTHDELALGVAKQTTGDLAGARTAYQAVLERWGTATPRSVTADEARARLAALPKSH